MSINLFDWKFFSTLILAAAGVIVPVIIWQVDLPSNALSLRLTSSIALRPVMEPSVQDIQIVLDGVNIKEPYLSTLELSNDGSKPIYSKDFDGNLEIYVDQGDIVRVSVESTQPNGIPIVLNSEGKTIKIKPLLLNPQDTVMIMVISSGGMPIFKPMARIAGISEVMYEDYTSKGSEWKKAIYLFPLAYLSFFLYFFYSVVVMYPNSQYLSRISAILTMVVCGISSSQLIRRGLDAAGLDDSKVNLSVFIITASVLSIPFYIRQVRVARLMKAKKEI